MQIKHNKSNIFIYADCHYNVDELIFKKRNNCQKKSQYAVIELMTKHC